MHLPAGDVAFLRRVIHGLHAQRMHTYVCGQRLRGAVALVLRFADAEHQRTLRVAHEHATGSHTQQSHTLPFHSEACQHSSVVHMDLLSSLLRHMDRYVDDPTHTSAPTASSLSLLVVKHADVSPDSWSGQLGFPGGLRDSEEDVDDVQALYRTVYASIGMPLQNTREFVCLGRMRDCPLMTRVAPTWRCDGGGAHRPVRARFVFLHVGSLTPSVTLARHVMERVSWVPLRRLQRAHVRMDAVAHPLQRVIPYRHARQQLAVSELLDRRTMLYFPSICVHPHIQHIPHHTHSSSSSNTSGSGVDDGNSCGPSSGPTGTSWHLWGFALRCASELTQLGRCAPALDWPLAACSSTVIQYSCIHALHGYYELGRQYYALKAHVGRMRSLLLLPPRRPRHATMGVDKDDPASVRCALHNPLPYTASLLLHSAPSTPSAVHVCSFLACALTMLSMLWLMAHTLYSVSVAVRGVCGVDATRSAWERRRAYYTEWAPYSVERERQARAMRRERAEGDHTADMAAAVTHRDGSGGSVAVGVCGGEDTDSDHRQVATHAHAVQRPTMHWASEHVQSREADRQLQRYLS